MASLSEAYAPLPLPLPIEIIVNIVEHLGWQPGAIGHLLRTSKTFNNIIKTHESHLSQNFTSHLYPPSPPRPILSSSLPPGVSSADPSLYCSSSASSESGSHRSHHSTPPLRFPYTFPWTYELHKRHTILSILPTSPLFYLSSQRILPIYEASPRLCVTCHRSGLVAFRNHSLGMLFELSDSRIAGGCDHGSDLTKGTRDYDGERKGQEFWIHQQEAIHLASVLALVWIASQLFDFGEKATWGPDSSCEHNGHDPATSTPASGTMDYDLVERQCIYRELALTHGPYFLWCSIHGSVAETAWVKKQLDEGVVGLKEYENGASTEPMKQSLQSVVLRRVCALKKCEVRDGWRAVFDCVAEEVTNSK